MLAVVLTSHTRDVARAGRAIFFEHLSNGPTRCSFGTTSDLDGSRSAEHATGILRGVRFPPPALPIESTAGAANEADAVRRARSQLSRRLENMGTAGG
jgi:hypothetical protein